jgi:MFS family permease
VIEDGDESEADVSVLGLGFFQVLVTFISGFFINKFGRRPMMLVGMAIVSITLLAGFFITFLVDEHESITIFIIFAYVLGYSISMGPICLMYAV